MAEIAVATIASAAKIETIKSDGSDAAILFVHGLDGDPIKSFRDTTSGLFWPDLIRKDERLLYRNRRLADFDIYSVNYSDAFSIQEHKDVSIEEIAQQVASALESHSILRTHNHVWIIAHSLGGILVKRILIKWSTNGYRRYIDRIVGISFLGVPSNGAPLAEVSDFWFGRLLSNWLGYNARLVSDLKTASSTNTFLAALENDWANFARDRNPRFPRISCAYETVAEYNIFWVHPIKIVPKIYTATACDGEAIAISKTHVALPKPSSLDDPIEDWLFNSMREAFIELDTDGEKFDRANDVGALWRLISFLQAGNRRNSGVSGIPFIDEVVNVSPTDLHVLEALRLSGPRYTGAAWSDVLERVAEQNSCVIVTINDRARRKISVSLDHPVVCPANGGGKSVFACHVDSCQ